jgi:hypothetical protein
MTALLFEVCYCYIAIKNRANPVISTVMGCTKFCYTPFKSVALGYKVLHLWGKVVRLRNELKKINVNTIKKLVTYRVLRYNININEQGGMERCFVMMILI